METRSLIHYMLHIQNLALLQEAGTAALSWATAWDHARGLSADIVNDRELAMLGQGPGRGSHGACLILFIGPSHR